jgi:hypothetical protein
MLSALIMQHVSQAHHKEIQQEYRSEERHKCDSEHSQQDELGIGEIDSDRSCCIDTTSTRTTNSCNNIT